MHEERTTVIDAHLHLYPGKEGFDPEALVNSSVVHGAWMLSANGIVQGQATDEDVVELGRRYPDFFVPFGYLDFDEAGPDRIDRLFDMGCVGLKAIFPGKAYDDPELLPWYERAAAHHMPILFHVGGASYWRPASATDPGVPMRSAGGAMMTIPCGPRGYIKNMDPLCIDAVAKTFPDLPLIMAHLGGTACFYDMARNVCHCNPNVYMDCSAAPKDEMLRGIRHGAGPEQILFGSDGSYPNSVRRAQEKIACFRYLETHDREAREAYGPGLHEKYRGTDAIRRMVMGTNAQRIVDQARARQAR